MRQAQRSDTAFLAALAAPGACAAPDPFDPSRIVVRAPRRGVTMQLAAADRGCAERLVALRLCVWSIETGHPTLRLARPGASGALEARQPVIQARNDAGRLRLVDAAESPLAWLARRRDKTGEALIGPHQLQAGERLRAELERARMLPRVTADWTRPTRGGGGGGPGEAMDGALAARQRASAALDAVGGPLAGLLIDVCGFLKGLETIEAERGWPRRSAKVALAVALERLAGHYGLSPSAHGRERAGMRSWRATLAGTET